MNIVTYKNGMPLVRGGLLDDFFDWSWPEFHHEKTPKANVSDKGDFYAVELELPGVDKKDIHVGLDNNVLTIKAERKVEKENKDQKYYIHEMSYGSYQRDFRLDDTVEAGKIKAKYENGILNLQLPKAQKAPEKRIAIE